MPSVCIDQIALSANECVLQAKSAVNGDHMSSVIKLISKHLFAERNKTPNKGLTSVQWDLHMRKRWRKTTRQRRGNREGSDQIRGCPCFLNITVQKICPSGEQLTTSPASGCVFVRMDLFQEQIVILFGTISNRKRKLPQHAARAPFLAL